MPVLKDIDSAVKNIRSGRMKGAILDPLPRRQHQEGPNCGFYALSIVLGYWREAGRDLDVAYARKRDMPADVDPQATPSLRAVGKQVGALTLEGSEQLSTGGVFTASQLASVAKAQRNCEARVYTRSDAEKFIGALCLLIDNGYPAIVAFDVEKGDPVEAQGTHSHWGVVIGHVTQGNKRAFVATHGHGEYYLWDAYALQRSNFGLANTIRRLPQERKLKVTLTPGPDSPVRRAAGNWNWGGVDSIVKLANRRGQPDSPIVDVHLKPGAMRPAINVPHDLAHHIIVVSPK